MADNKSSLFIVSIPFQRLVKSHLSNLLLSSLPECDVLIVCPDKIKLIEYCFPSKLCINGFWLRSPKSKSIRGILWKIVDRLRMLGWWYRIRPFDPFYWINRYRFYRPDRDIVLPAFIRYLLDLLVPIFASYKSWIALNNNLGWFLYRDSRFVGLVEGYRSVSVIQAANWGFQDAFIAYYSRKFGWKSYFIPYSTDQLLCNGYLNNVDSLVFVQGPLEEQVVDRYHATYCKPSYERTGSVWWSILKQCASDSHIDSSTAKSEDNAYHILYAGNSDTYFPKGYELTGVLAFAQDVRALAGSGLWSSHKVVITYRPIKRLSSCEKQTLSELLENRSEYFEFRIDVAPAEVIGLNEFSNLDSADVLNSYYRSFSNTDILIIFGLSSMCIDLAALGIPGISYFPFCKSDALPSISEKGEFLMVPGLPICRNNDELLKLVCNILGDRLRATKLADEILNVWHYNRLDTFGIIKTHLNRS